MRHAHTSRILATVSAADSGQHVSVIDCFKLIDFLLDPSLMLNFPNMSKGDGSRLVVVMCTINCIHSER